MKFTLYEDPGHGWLAVSVATLEQLGCDRSITAYSYRHGGTAYLEEDLDMGTFFEAYKAMFGTDAQWITVYQENTPIRGYQRYYPNPAPKPVERQQALF